VTDLLFAGVLTGSPHLVFGGSVAAPPEVLPDDTVSIGRACGFEAAAGMGASLAHVAETAQAASAAGVNGWQAAAPIGTAAADLSRSAAPVTHGCADVASGALSHVGHAAMAWQSADRLAGYGRAGYGMAAPVRGAAANRWAPAASIGLPCRHAFQAARPAHGVTRPRLWHARPVDAGRVDRQQAAMPPPPGLWLPSPIPPTPPVQHPVNLLFRAALDHTTHLLFGYIGPGPVAGAVVIPTLRVYIVINAASLRRVSNNLSLPVSNISISIDTAGAHWTWSAVVPLSALDDLQPAAPAEPVELEAELNGLTWRLLVERMRETERFGSASLQLGGRGIAAALSEPVFPVVSHDNVAGALTAQQIADLALSVNGVPLGWTLGWQCADWLIPAGGWVHTGTPLSAIVRLAEAAGGYVQADRSAKTLSVLPRYPLAPWDWGSATPDIVLPASAVIERGAEHIVRPGYNVVYVAGPAAGVRARIKRTGSAGDQAAQMVVDSLVTHADAARGRGLSILGDTGPQQMITLETGILPVSGIIPVGALMDWTRGATSRRGLVRALAVSASVPSGAGRDPVRVRQTVTVESHG